MYAIYIIYILFIIITLDMGWSMYQDNNIRLAIGALVQALLYIAIINLAVGTRVRLDNLEKEIKSVEKRM